MVTHTYPRVTYSDPKVTHSDPKETHSDPTPYTPLLPYLHLPQLALFRPLVRSNETSGGWWWWVGGYQF